MATNTLGEFSDGEDDFVFEIDENLWKKSDPEVWEWSDPEADDLIRNINEEEILARVYGNDVAVIRNSNQEEILTGEWSDPEADDLIRNINEEEILASVYGNDDVGGVQTGRGEKRKNESDDDETESEDEQDEGQYYYTMESRRKYHSKKFGMTATDHRVRFNNVLADRDLLESYESTLKIFHHLLEEIKEGMAPNDQVRFILRSEQLETPISLPFMTVEQLSAERVYSELERVIQSNEEFRLNDTVTIDINHVKTPQGSGRKKRTTYDIRDYLKQKNSIICINNKDDLCLARALAVAIARIEKDPKYKHIRDSNRPLQRERAFDLHQAANVPLGPCGLNEVELFQQYLTNYQIIVVSGDHDNSIIYPPQSSGTDEKPTISLYLHDNHFDVITKLPGFLCRSYFCFRCHKAYSNTTDHICSSMCRSCRGFGCVLEGEGIVCSECKRLFKSQRCYDYFIKDFLIQNAIHYEIIYRGAKSLSMTVPLFNIKFIDSINFIPMSLAKFPKTFGQDELCKGYFPHMFNKDENQNYVGPIPCQNDYGVNFMKPGEREAFIAWHDEQVANNYRYDFREEIIKYCRSDVDILRKCCLLYREMFRKETDIDPFNKALTIASYCQEVYSTNFLKKDTIAVFNNDRQWKVKQSNDAVTWLSYISEKEDLYIKHVRNGGEKRVGDYSLDGYCEETNTAYEFQGCFWHGKDLCDVTYTNHE